MTWLEGFLQGVAATVTAGIILKVLRKCYRHLTHKRNKNNNAIAVVSTTDNSISKERDDNSISHD